MKELPFLILFGAAVVAFVFLLKGRISPATNKAAEIVVAALASINIAGALGLGWFVVEMLIHDGVMVLEILSCVVLMALLAGFTAGGLALKRRGKTTAAIVLLAVGAVPVILTYGFLLYLTVNPIDWR